MMGIECEAWAHEFPKFNEETCTMLKSKPICKLPGNYGDYKWPKLEEALQIICGRELGDEAHDAMADTLACRDLFFKMREES